MNRLAKLALGAVMAGGIAVLAVPPAQAGISIGIGVGIPGPGWGPGWEHRRWCYYHPGACGGGYPGPYVDGYYWAGHGYWHGGRWWGGRDRWHGGWRYR